MKFDLSKIKAAPVSRLKTYEYDFPYILCIPVHGDGTGGIEALSSYLCRQAELLSERAHTYTERLVKMSNIGGADKLKKSRFMELLMPVTG